MYAYALHERPIKREAKHSPHFILPVCCFLLTFLNSFCLPMFASVERPSPLGNWRAGQAVVKL